jgi:hypothetical protein
LQKRRALGSIEKLSDQVSALIRCKFHVIMMDDDMVIPGGDLDDVEEPTDEDMNELEDELEDAPEGTV